MPQMAPASWLSLMSISLVAIIMTCSYFLFFSKEVFFGSDSFSNNSGSSWEW